MHFTAPNNASISYDPSAFKSGGGPLDVSYSNYALPITPGIQQGLQKLGLKSIPGLNSGDLIGYAYSASSLNPRNKIRSSSETSFLQMALMNSTLQVYQQTMAEKIHFDTNKKAIAVSVTSFGISYDLRATKEVIVSAGAVSLITALSVRDVIYSQKIVQITSNAHGLRHCPRQTLERHSIPVISDLPGVGQNLWVRLPECPSFAVSAYS